MSLQSLTFAGTGIGRAAVAVLLALGVPAAATADTKQTETVDRVVAMQPGGTLTVKNFSGRVEITGGDRSDVAVHAVRRATRENLDRIKLEVTSDGTNVTVEANHRVEKVRGKDNVVETDLTIQVPRDANLDVQVFSSPVVVRGVAGARHKVKSFSGDLHLDGLSGPVDAETFSGAIDFAAGGWSGGHAFRFKTFSGDVAVRLPQEAAGSVEFDSFSGDLNSDLPLVLRSKTKRTLRAEVGASGASARGELYVKTFSGDVRLLK
jgi:DUF4097 and DUF4098 domain-containing protein YvlB